MRMWVRSVESVGVAIRAMRKASGLRQDDISGVSHVFLRDLEISECGDECRDHGQKRQHGGELAADGQTQNEPRTAKPTHGMCPAIHEEGALPVLHYLTLP